MVSDGTSTQVAAQMIDKCRIEIVQRELYNVRGPLWIVIQKLREKNTVAIKIALVTCLIDLYENLSPWTVNSFSFMSLVLA